MSWPFPGGESLGIYVKRFSIGMPPIIRVSMGRNGLLRGALPIGGFVMMAGQEDVPLTTRNGKIIWRYTGGPLVQ